MTRDGFGRVWSLAGKKNCRFLAGAGPRLLTKHTLRSTYRLGTSTTKPAGLVFADEKPNPNLNLNRFGLKTSPARYHILEHLVANEESANLSKRRVYISTYSGTYMTKTKPKPVGLQIRTGLVRFGLVWLRTEPIASPTLHLVVATAD